MILTKEGATKRNRIFGGIGILWGGGIFASRLLGATAQGSEAYMAGQQTALIFGAAMLLVGLYYLSKAPS